MPASIEVLTVLPRGPVASKVEEIVGSHAYGVTANDQPDGLAVGGADAICACNGVIMVTANATTIAAAAACVAHLHENQTGHAGGSFNTHVMQDLRLTRGKAVGNEDIRTTVWVSVNVDYDKQHGANNDTAPANDRTD